MQMDYLRYLLVIEKCGSLNRASRNLLMTQQRLSKILAAVESELDCTVFIRTSRGVTLTGKGEKVLDAVKDILGIYDELCENIKNEKFKSLHGDLHVFRPSYLWDKNYIEMIINEFSQKYKTNIIAHEYVDFMNIDIKYPAFYLNTVGKEGMYPHFGERCKIMPKHKVKLTCYAAKSSEFATRYQSISLKTLKKQNIIIYRPGGKDVFPFRRMWERIGIPEHVKFVDNALAYHAALRRGEGVIVTSKRILVEPYSSYLVEIPLRDNIFCEFGLVFPDTLRTDPLAAAFIAFASAYPSPSFCQPVR